MSSVLAVDLGGTKICSALVNPKGEVIKQDTCLTMPDGGFELVVDRILVSLKNVMPEGKQPAGIGIAVPAYID